MSGAASHVPQSTTILGSVHGIWDACWKLPIYLGLFWFALLTALASTLKYHHSCRWTFKRFFFYKYDDFKRIIGVLMKLFTVS